MSILPNVKIHLRVLRIWSLDGLSDSELQLQCELDGARAADLIEGT
jgi:hypothetical protein